MSKVYILLFQNILAKKREKIRKDDEILPFTLFERGFSDIFTVLKMFRSHVRVMDSGLNFIGRHPQNAEFHNIIICFQSTPK